MVEILKWAAPVPLGCLEGHDCRLYNSAVGWLAVRLLSKELDMAHAVSIQSREQHIHALDVLDRVGGTWQAVGTSAAPVFLLTDAQYDALIQAGVVRTNGQEDQARGKKAPTKKPKS